MSLLGNLLQTLELLITEHGSAAILREHLALLRAKAAELERSHDQAQAKARELEARLLQAEGRARELEQQLQTLRDAQHTGPACDACGGNQLRRTGSRPDPIFGDLGAKLIRFTCADCGSVTEIANNPGEA